MTTVQREKFPFGVTHCSPHSIRDLLAEVRSLLSDRTLSPRTILCLNSHIYNLACDDAELRGWLAAARIIATDGMAIVWTARLLGYEVPERCNMTEAYHAFLADTNMPANRGLLIGCSQAEAEAAASKAAAVSQHCRMAGAYSGFLSDEEYRKILAGHAEIDFVFLGMGSPKTERISHLASEICPRAIVWGIGGGTIRIAAGTMTEAPILWRRLGLQWLHRLASEPSTLWRRYILGNPRFVLRILRMAARRRPTRQR